MKSPFALSVCTFLFIANPAFAQGDPEVIAAIIKEGKENNQVWDHLLYLSEEIGTRLTGSTNLEEASNWTKDQFASWGLQNAHLHQWGEIPMRFDRGPSSCRMLSPVGRPLDFTTRCWTPGTDGPVKGHVIKQPASTEELAALGDKVKGAFVLTEGRNRRNRGGVTPPGEEPVVREDLRGALIEAGAVGFITAGRNDLVITSGGWRGIENNEVPTGPVEIGITRADYDDMIARIDAGEEVVLEVNADNNFSPGPIPVYNTIAEIPGTEWPEQVVVVSAHLDTWDGPGAMGTQDNGTGSSVTLEAARLLMHAGAKPKRTIRFILWTGEEQGLLGSDAYVNSLSDDEKANISACLVDDGGTNYQGGLVCIESMKPMLEQAVAPVTAAFPDMPVEIIVRNRMPRGGGSDHASFNRVGIPGFFWEESGSGGREGKNYQFIHHTQHDTPRYAVPEYLVQSSVSTAVTAYNLACADTLLPRQGPEPEVAEPAPGAAAAPADTTPFNVVEGPVSGSWNAVASIGEQGGFEFTLTLELADDGRVRGKSASQFGERVISKGSFNKDTGELRCTTVSEERGEIEIVAAVSGDSMKGTMTVANSEMQMTFEAKKAAAVPDIPTGVAGGPGTPNVPGAPDQPGSLTHPAPTRPGGGG
jgi:carboxypeptidase Q